MSATGPHPKIKLSTTSILKYPKDFQLNIHVADPRKNHQFFSEFEELIFAMAVCGRFPFHRDHSGGVKFSRLSVPCLYWLLIYSFLATIAASIFCESYVKILGEKSFDVAISSARNCVLLSSVLVMPLSNWREWRLIADYINNMDAFLVNFERLTGKKVRMGMRYFVIANILINPIFALGITQVEKESLGIRNFYHRSLYVLMFCGHSYFSWFVWCGQRTIWRVADYLQLELAKVAAKSRRKLEVSSLHIHKLKCIWVKGTELLLETGRAAGFTILTVVLINSGLMVLGSYGFVRGIAVYDFTAATHHALNSVFNLVWLIMFCETGFRSTKQMGNRIIAPLSSIDTTGLSELAAVVEVTVFLHIVSLHPPVITCGGLITLSRSFMMSVFSNILTYLIVIVQFKKAVSEPSQLSVTVY